MLILSGRVFPYHEEGWWKIMEEQMWLQVSTAYKLARHYGHLWGHVNPLLVQRACEDCDQDMAARVLPSIAIARLRAKIARYASGNQSAMRPQGGNAPKYEYNIIVHQTLTGRLNWRILPNGVVTLIVEHAICGPVFEVIATPDYDNGYQIIEAKSHYGCSPSHIGAAFEALQALQEPIYDTEEAEGN